MAGFFELVSTDLPSGFSMLPRSGDRSMRSLRDKLGTLAFDRLSAMPLGKVGRLQGPFARFREWLERTARSADRAALFAALRRVDALGPVLSLDAPMVDPVPVLGDLVPSLALAVRRGKPDGLAERLTWEVPVRRVLDPLVGRVLQFDPPATGLSADGTTLELRAASGAIDLLDDSLPMAAPSFFPLSDAPAPALATADSNPLFMLEEHPEKAGNAVSLGGRSVEEWRTALGEALGLIRDGLPELHREMLDTLERIVPVGWSSERHLSASYREAPGLVYLTLHPSPLTLAEALIHETQHGKLNAMSWFDPVLENGQSTWTPSPVRPDLRPLWGVLLAVHAFVPVSALHLRLSEIDHPLARSPAFAKRRADVLAANRDGLATLQRLARPTDVGRRVLAALAALQASIEGASPDASSDATAVRLG